MQLWADDDPVDGVREVRVFVDHHRGVAPEFENHRLLARLLFELPSYDRGSRER